MASAMLSQLMAVVDTFMVGHLGRHELAAAGLGNVYFMMLQHPVFGCATALDTLLAQAFGARQFDAYGRWTQTGLIILMAFSLPFTLMLMFAGPILSTLGVESELAARAGVFCKYLAPGVPAHLAFHAITKYLQAQSRVLPSVLVALAANVVNAFANWAFIHALGLGFRGAPLATTISRWSQCVLILGYIVHRRRALAATLPPLHVQWRGLPRKAAVFFRLGAPGAVMLALEAWFFEVSSFLASLLDTAAFDAHVVLMNICAFTFLSLPFAMGIAASIRVGQTLGAGDGAAARATARVSLVLVLGVMMSLAAIKIGLRNELGKIFSDEEDVVARVGAIMYIAAIFQISDGVQAVTAGVLRGMGRQLSVACLNLVGFWLLGGSVGPALTFGAHMGVGGLWWGMAVGLTITAAISIGILSRVDWEAEARAARTRTEMARDTIPAGPVLTSSTSDSFGKELGEVRRGSVSGEEVPAVPLARIVVLGETESQSGERNAMDAWNELNPAAQQAEAAAGGVGGGVDS